MKLAIADIEIVDRLRDINERDMPRLVQSFREIGQLTPILVRTDLAKPRLVAGAHRIEAAKRLGWTEIEAEAVSLKNALTPRHGDLLCRRMEIDENISRSDLDAATRVIFADELLAVENEIVAIEKAAVEAKAYAEAQTRAEKDNAKGRRDRAEKTAKRATAEKALVGGNLIQNENVADRTTKLAHGTVELVAKKTGLSKGTLMNARSLANEVGRDVLRTFAGTSNGKLAEIKAFPKLRVRDPKAAERVVLQTKRAKEKGHGNSADDARNLGISVSGAYGAIAKVDKANDRHEAMKSPEGSADLMREAVGAMLKGSHLLFPYFGKIPEEHRALLPEYKQVHNTLTAWAERLKQLKGVTKQKRTGTEHKYATEQPKVSKAQERELLRSSSHPLLKDKRKEISEKKFTTWLVEKLGTDKWVVAPRLTPKLSEKGYTLALSQKKFDALKAEFAAS